MREQFMRIAMAQLRSTYPFKPQRRAVAARMWVKFLERQELKKKERARQLKKLWYDKNIDRRKQYNLENAEKIKQKKKQYYIENKEKLESYKKSYYKKRKVNDPVYRAICNLRTYITYYCKNIQIDKKFKTMDALGCTSQEFKQHLESKFTEGMTWENYGAWHVDHIKPISLATTEQEAIELSHYTNLQPLWAADNLSKGNKYD
jgi:hypothetical protein